MTRMTLLLAATALAGLAPAAGHARADGPASAPARVYEYPADRAGKGLAVWAASSRAGLIFTDGEAPDVRAAVSGAAGTTTVEYGATEHDGPWRAKGTLTFDEGVGQRPLPLKLPGRGLYRLSLTARSGEATAKAETPLAVLPEPDPPARASPWGIFYIRPLSPAAAEKTPLRASAAGIRRLGASWVRLNFWHFSYGKVTVADGRATAACGYYRRIVREMRRQGLFIMGEFALVPRELSSRPNEAKRRGDSGPLFARVPPKDYRLWEAMVEQMARDFAGDIDVWEVGNEPDLRGKYWAGTPEEYVEHVRHTARAVKRGHPKARIAVGGFTGINDFSRKVLTACGDSIDIVSFHYTDAGGRARQWRSALRALELDRSMWNTEERSEVPLRDLACGVERVFKFIQAHDRYGGYRPLMRADLTPRPSAVLYAVGAKCIGDGRFDGGATRNGCRAFYFRRGPERVGVFEGAPRRAKLFGSLTAAIAVEAEPLAGGKPLAVIDMWGRSRPLALREGVGRFDWTTERMVVRGARSLELVEAASAARTVGALVFEAEEGARSPGWNVSRHTGFSEGRTVDIWAADDPPKDGYRVELTLDVPKAGRYELLFSGNSLARLARPRSLSPFVWTIDGGPARKADDAPKVIEGVPGAPEGLSVLGEVDLTAGKHTFRLRLTGRRDRPDKRYALWFDALALRPAD